MQTFDQNYIFRISCLVEYKKPFNFFMMPFIIFCKGKHFAVAVSLWAELHILSQIIT